MPVSAQRTLLMGLLMLASFTLKSQTMPTHNRDDAIELSRFMGAWHVIAHVPYFGERGHVASRDEYRLRDDGKIAVHYVYQEGFSGPVKTLDSKATVKAGSGNRQWTTWFFGVIPTKYRTRSIIRYLAARLLPPVLLLAVSRNLFAYTASNAFR